MGAEIERAPKLTLDVVEPIDQPRCDFGQKEVVAGESGGGAVAVPANRVALQCRGCIDHDSRGREPWRG